MSKPKNRTLIITDDEEVQAEELNPFSFREFLRWKNQEEEEEEEQKKRFDADVTNLTFDPEVRSCFFSEPSLNQSGPQDDETDWGRSFQSYGVDSTSSLCTEEEEEEEEEETRFTSQPEGGGAGGGGVENYEGDDETSVVEPASSSSRRRSGRSHIQQLKEENMALRRTIGELQRRSEVSEHRVSDLSEELLQRRRQEEQEARDLESMVQSVEQNLKLMTKRALKAENTVSKLKLEIQQLQTQVEALHLENDSLKAAESEVVMTMRQNAQMASEYLNKTVNHAHISIHQLMGEAQTLRLVSQLLQSIDKISYINPES
ncbi:endosome-associated-trafficking regulator 1 [Sphaeramia orbicularis]|uniref:Endosome-associated-trafficking regulator 1 n=1 Tax=Sphaeramia orbicularis TaxID=375764 RepID=A0A673ALC7_9TELE|nr:endosome-associated-trafficking regulator 1 [Sphaeramia orbicularis]